MCKALPVPSTGRTIPPPGPILVFRPAVACAKCGGAVFVDEGELFCVDCPLAIIVVTPPASARRAS
jgi:hypothetical protein